MTALAEAIARAFHERYEALAPRYGYETREASAKPWEQVPAENKALMVGVVSELLRDGVIAEGVPDSGEGREIEAFPAQSDLPQRFYDEGMVWLANRLLHPFGWAVGIMAETKGDERTVDRVTGLMLLRTADTDGIILDHATEIDARRRFFAALRRGPTVRVVPETAEEDGPPTCDECGHPLWEVEGETGCPYPRCGKYRSIPRP